jgi:hypothetical protein
MKNPLLLLVLQFLIIQSIFGQVSFKPLDTLEYSTSNRLSTYQNGKSYPVDFNNDGYDDLLFLRGQSMYLKINTGQNELGEDILVYTDAEHIYSISNFTDLNDDGLPDVAISSLKGMKILSNRNGKYQMAFQTDEVVSYGRLILFDEDKDGNSDLAYSKDNTINIYHLVANGFGNHSTFYSDPNGTVFDFAICDLNADNQQDIVISSYPGSFRIVHGNSAGTFNEVFSKSLNSLAFFEIGDLSRDGFQDITYLEWNNNLFTLIYKKDSNTYTERAVFSSNPVPQNLFGFKLVDLKSNGTLDLVYNGFFTMTTRENNGLGEFLPPVELFENPFSPFNYYLFDLNNDNIQDLLLNDYNRFAIAIIESDGTLTNAITGGTTNDFWDVLHEDVDDDGLKDLISVSRTGSLEIRWANSDHNFNNVSRYDIPLNAYYGAVADINKDGVQDLLFTMQSNTNSVSQVMVLEGKGHREFKKPRAWKYFPMAAKPHLIDLNKDGILDFVSQIRYGDQVVWLDIENTEFDAYFTTNRTINTQGSGITNMSYDDINNDGYIDLFTANAYSKNVSILKNNKNGGFTETILVPHGVISAIHGVNAMDFDLDGFKDLLVITENQSSFAVEVFLNDHHDHFIFALTYSLHDIYQPTNIDVVDIDKDQDLDFIVSAWDYLSTNVFIYEDDNYTNVGENIIASSEQSSRIYADLNADGKVDLFTASFSGNSFIQWNNSVSEPETTENEITIEEIGLKSIKLNLGSTTASGHLVVITKGDQFTFTPDDNYFYTANLAFGIGSQIGSNSYVVNAGDEESLEITGLASATNYLISVYAYNVNSPQVTIINYTGEGIQKPFTTLNSPPQIAAVPDQTGINLEKLSLLLDVKDEDDLIGNLQYQFTSSNESVVPLTNISVVTSGNKSTLTILPVGYGETSIAVMVTDTANNNVTAKFKYTSIVVGIDEVPAKLSFNISPNPFSSKVEIEHPDRRFAMTIYNGTGALVRQFDKTPESVDLSELPGGIYFFRTSDGRSFKAIK